MPLNKTVKYSPPSNRRTPQMALRYLAIALVVAGLSCNKEESSKPKAGSSASTTKVQLALNWKPEPEFGGFYAAQINGDYQKEKLDVEILPGGSGTPTVQMIGAGTVPFGIVSADEIILARSKGNDVVALFAVYQTNPQ